MNSPIVRFGIIITALLFLAGCTPKPAVIENGNINTAPTPLPSPTVSATPSSSPASGAPVTYADYENGAMGYRIRRPEKWYWQHLMKNDIAASNPAVTDYFMADRNPLPGLGSEYLGMLVIEVSGKTPADIADATVDLEKTSTTVGGSTANRYAGVRNGYVVIEYQFTKGSQLYRLIFTSADGAPADAAIFEEMVKSFTFTR
ncbi:MAG: hypothetical protein G01um101431_756 [Parcubacteria group bacterium Gr01-1014_31]|nr:MAG: hypothetical protein G01um101431_756 [Parcubacteria group bacterium Gr01-1014_31]